MRMNTNLRSFRKQNKLTLEAAAEAVGLSAAQVSRIEQGKSDTMLSRLEHDILGNAEEAALPRPWTELSNDEIDALTLKAYTKFHSRPFFLLKHALQVRSFDEFKRKFSAWFDMQFRQESISAKDDHFQAYGENKGKLDWYKKISKWSSPF